MSTHPSPETPATLPSPARATPEGVARGFSIGALVCALIGLILLVHPFTELAILFGIVSRRCLPHTGPRRIRAIATGSVVLGAAALVLGILY